jgi:hypothetical protein
MSEQAPQRFHLTSGGRVHRVEVAEGGLRKHARWFVDETLVAEKRTGEDRFRLSSEEHGVLAVRCSALGKPRRATWYEPSEDAEAIALTGLGGVDLVPEPGSPAAAYEQRVRDHPRRHVALATAGGVAKVVVPLVLFYLLAQLAFSLPLPDLPRPDLPDLPWPNLPNLPDIPWPDLPDWELPGWVRWTLDKAKYVGPVVLAIVLARGEIHRRRKQDELRRPEDDES